MEKYKLISENIKRGQKITLLTSGWMGGMISLQTTYQSCQPKPHYQNCPESMYGVLIVGIPKGKKKLYERSIDYNTPMVVYDGWLDIDTESIVYDKKIVNGTEYKESKYNMHDRRYFTNLIYKYPGSIIQSI